MDSIFHLGEAERAAFLRHMTHSFGSTYICLWSYSPLPSNCLLFLDGFYHDHEKVQQPSSSSGSTLATRLFTAYCRSGNYIDNGRVPGFAFRNNVPYLEMQADYLHTMISTQLQLQFYQEAGIKTAVFMGCAMGEIELGFSTEPLQVNLQMEIQNWFPSDFSRQIPPPTNETSSSSLSVESNKYFDIPNSCFNADLSTESLLLQDSVSMSTLIPDQQIPTMETGQDLAPIRHHRAAFTSYRAALAPVAATLDKPNLFKRAVLFFKNLQIQGNQPTPNQLHHVIAERRRREKLNESFKILKTLLPQVTKKDKASVLSRTTEYLSSLRSQLGELTRRNVALQTQILTAEREGGGDQELGVATSTHHHQRVTINVEIAPSISEARFLDLRMSLRSEKCSLTDFVARVLGFLKRMGNVSLLSVQSNTRFVEESTAVHTLILRLKAEGDEFDESGFQEAVRRVVDDLPHDTSSI